MVDRNAACTPFAAGVLLTFVSSQENCLKSFFWLSLGVALDHGSVVSLILSLGTPLQSTSSFNTARTINYLYWL